MTDKVKAILDNYQREVGQLISILQDVQAEYNYLPKEALVQVSQGLGLPESQVYSVASFFKAFSLKPRGRHLINVCLGTACHVRGAGRLLEAMERKLRVGSGGTTPDLRFTLESVRCVGACALGPIVVVDGEFHGQMTSDKLDAVFDEYN